MSLLLVPYELYTEGIRDQPFESEFSKIPDERIIKSCLDSWIQIEKAKCFPDKLQLNLIYDVFNISTHHALKIVIESFILHHHQESGKPAANRATKPRW
jgi:hypothetical protein